MLTNCYVRMLFSLFSHSPVATLPSSPVPSPHRPGDQVLRKQIAKYRGMDRKVLGEDAVCALMLRWWEDIKTWKVGCPQTPCGCNRPNPGDFWLLRVLVLHQCEHFPALTARENTKYALPRGFHLGCMRGICALLLNMYYMHERISSVPWLLLGCRDVHLCPHTGLAFEQFPVIPQQHSLMKADELSLQEKVFKDVLIVCLWLSVAASARKRDLSFLLLS